MSSGVCTVAVDVGNTAVKLALREGDQVVDHTIKHDHSHWHLEAIHWVQTVVACQETRWRISSVHRHAAETLIEAIENEVDASTIDCITFDDVPIEVAVDSPSKLGIDRLLSAFAASRLVPLQSRRSGMAVVDAGSAITVDWINHAGHFCGGAILPGLSLQSRALAMGTDALPEILWNTDRPLRLPATNTNDAIHGGILIGVAGAIDSLVSRYFQGQDEPLTSPGIVILTGGDANTLSPHLQSPHQTHAHLVCRGLLELPVSQ
ncbi:type III pantothenate kinase [Rubripirellula amarantea]|nr:type III pantothenate kinase [Rubripirellula amarantea]